MSRFLVPMVSVLCLACTAIRPLAPGDDGGGRLDGATIDAGARADGGGDLDAGEVDGGDGSDAGSAPADGGCAVNAAARCLGDERQTCVMGTWTTVETCALGCAGSPAGCEVLIPSNVPSRIGLGVGTADLALPSTGTVDYYIFETDSGRIHGITDNGGGRDVVLRAPGPGVISGVYYELVRGSGGAPDMGVFAMRSLDLDAGEEAMGNGDAALVLLVERDAVIDGAFTVDADYETEEGPTLRGAARANGGDGPGAGPDGVDTSHGGAGASFGAPGGIGGRGPGVTMPYGNAELVPLLGGSGGGDGGGLQNGDGGESGGAIQLSAGSSIAVGASGYVSACAEGGTGGGGSLVSNGLGGGGGGGSGGAILLEAPTVSIAGRVVATGGGGGQGAMSTSSRGANGQDASAATVPAPGGFSGGGLGGAGGDGSDESALAEAGARGTYGGGGGGGAGRIRINNGDGTGAYPNVLPRIDTSASSVGVIQTGVP